MDDLIGGLSELREKLKAKRWKVERFTGLQILEEFER